MIHYLMLESSISRSNIMYVQISLNFDNQKILQKYYTQYFYMHFNPKITLYCIYVIILMKNKNIEIQLVSLQFNKTINLNQLLYFQLSYSGSRYFSSVISFSKIWNHQYNMNDHFFFLINPQSQRQVIYLTRYQNHIPIYTFELEISDVSLNKASIKRIQIKANEYLTIKINIEEQSIIEYTNKQTTQVYNYFTLKSITYLDLQKQISLPQCDSTTTYFKIMASEKYYILPHDHAHKNVKLLIDVSRAIYIEYHLNQVFVGKTKKIKFKDLNFRKGVELFLKEQTTGYLKVQGQQQIRSKKQKSEIVQALQILLYDIKLNLVREIEQNSRLILKLYYEGKMYEIQAQFMQQRHKVIFRNIIFLSGNSKKYFKIRLYKNDQLWSSYKFFFDQLIDNSYYQRKIYQFDPDKFIGNIKFKVQKDKTLSVPKINPFWRDNIKTNINLLKISQISFYHPRQINLDLYITDGKVNKYIQHARNLNDPVISHKTDKQFYIFKLEKQQNLLHLNFKDKLSQNIEGSGKIDINNLKLGQMPIELDIVNGQNIVGSVNCIINNVPNVQFCKSALLQTLEGVKNKQQSIQIQINQISFTNLISTNSNKISSLKSLIQVNSIQKIIYFPNSTKELVFRDRIINDKSDKLIFHVDYTQPITVNFKFFISHNHHQSQKYGFSHIKFCLSQFKQTNSLKFIEHNIRDSSNQIIGKISITIKCINALKELRAIEKYDKICEDVSSNKKQILDRRTLISSFNQHKESNSKRTSINQKNENKKLPIIIQKLKTIDQDDEQILERNIRQLESQIQVSKQLRNKKDYVVQKKSTNNYRNYINQSIIKVHNRHIKKVRQKNQPYIDQFKGLKSILHQFNDQDLQIYPTYYRKKNIMTPFISRQVNNFSRLSRSVILQR